MNTFKQHQIVRSMKNQAIPRNPIIFRILRFFQPKASSISISKSRPKSARKIEISISEEDLYQDLIYGVYEESEGKKTE